MPELLRSIVSRLREHLGNRRRVPRYQVRLTASLTLFEEKPHVREAKRAPTLAGYTQDISVNGLALILPAIRIGDKYLTDGRALLVHLELPSGAATQMRVIAARYERLEQEEDTPHANYLIGARIIFMSDADRERFIAYIEEQKE